MTILSTIQQACSVLGLPIPTGVLSSTQREHIELRDLANEMAQRIAFDGHDWTLFKSLATLTGNGVDGSFPFPSDYKRMLKKARLWPSSSPYSTLTHYPDTDTWLGMQVQNFRPTIGGWTIIGDRIFIDPPLQTLSTVKFYYLTDRIVTASNGTTKTNFTSDTDTFRLNERVLRLGIIWQWRANKGLPYAEDLSTYEDALSMLQGSDKGSNILTIGQQRWPSNFEYAFPGVIVP